jgi:hypothetical protein
MSTNYAITHNGQAFTPDGRDASVSDANEHNRKLDAVNLAVWHDTIPWTFPAYYTLASDGTDTTKHAAFRTHGTVSTWLGTVIGTVTEARVYRHNLGGRFVSLRVKGTNGATYYGRASYDNGNFVNLRMAKERPR